MSIAAVQQKKANCKYVAKNKAELLNRYFGSGHILWRGDVFHEQQWRAGMKGLW